MNTSIQPLPREVAAKIKSSTSITHLNGVVLELAKNALDANARNIYVTVDYRRGGCVAEDDGDGIPPAEFQSEGGLGKAHHTSKFHPETAVPGRKGCFLASLSSLALLTITSHHSEHASTNTVIFHHSAPVARLFPAPNHHGLQFRDHGTRVTVNDLFGNMPVRVKSRALCLQKPEEMDRQWDDLRYLLTALALANDGLQKLVVSDADRVRKMTIRPQASRDKGKLDLQRIDSVVSQVGLVQTGSSRKWHAVSATVPQLTIQAALSLAPSPSRKVQFVSFGTDPVLPLNHTNALFSEVNRLFSLSDFGNTDYLSTRLAPSLEADGRRLGLATVNKWPMFYIRIDSDSTLAGTTEELPEADRSLQRILDILTLMMNEFLKQHNMRPRGEKRQREASAQRTEIPARPRTTAPRVSTTTSRSELSGRQVKLPSFSRLSVSGDFGGWSRVKSANSHSSGDAQQEKDDSSQKPVRASRDNPDGHAATTPTTPAEQQPIFNGPIDTASEAQTRDTPEKQAQDQGDAVIPWVDPHTGARHWINSRTGQSVNVRPSAASALASRPATPGSMLSRVLSRKRPTSAVSDAQSLWLENLLDNWNNPVFGRSERPISALDTDQEHEASPEISTPNFHKQCGLDSFEVSKYRGRLSKRELAKAKVIGQVDCKFILVEMCSRDEASALILIDQHAADERCRVERLSEEFFSSSKTVHTTEIEPLIIDVPVHEALLFRRQADFLSSWGIEYAVEQSKRSGRATISVSALPTLIAERCRTEPDQLMNLLRTEIWKRAEEEGNRRLRTPVSENSGHGERWVSKLAGCPQGILDMLNSRACRTSIMFNDVLSIDDCKSLVSRLAGCVFPFQCAHGRPSMVPLVDFRNGLDHLEDEYAIPGGQNLRFIEAFERWQVQSQSDSVP
ncbi:putative DNA mismatch repair protein (Mlh3) [Aspergillus stella-maris]|uniref:putative DNA mismatch repair protein (Mlh3) n=1 Tax=Aspergillus stella-maris TaxID=1810926 RepID=UPI003CCE10D2